MSPARCPHAASGCNGPTEGECLGLCMPRQRPYVPLPTITVQLPLDQAVALYMATTADTRDRVRLARRELVKAIGAAPV